MLLPSLGLWISQKSREMIGVASCAIVRKLLEFVGVVEFEFADVRLLMSPLSLAELYLLLFKGEYAPKSNESVHRNEPQASL